MRLDLFLVENKLASSRTQAQDFIENGYVYLNQGGKQTKLQKPSFNVDDNNKAFIVVESNELQKYVSRGGLKLESALKNLNLSIDNKSVLDMGQSTGGFTDCLLQHGASHVVGVDVGHAQLHASLVGHKKVSVVENLNVKELSSHQGFLSLVPAGNFDLIVADVSFISLGKVVDHLKPYLRTEGEYLFLVKPQFECGPEYLDKNGIVKDPSVYKKIEDEIRKKMLQCFNNVEAYIKSDLIGKDGNQEFFVYGKNRS
ncbi:TlyA family RNA methyltransferase [bacterium]|nr:TlyA family RNA methyltransferase [bacterium]